MSSHWVPSARGSILQTTSHVSGDPTSVTLVQTPGSWHSIGQSPSHVSWPSTTPSPQTDWLFVALLVALLVALFVALFVALLVALFVALFVALLVALFVALFVALLVALLVALFDVASRRSSPTAQPAIENNNKKIVSSIGIRDMSVLLTILKIWAAGRRV
jgi:hypothetical protein